MRYRIIATSLADRRRLLGVDQDSNHYLITIEAFKFNAQPIDAEAARALQYNRTWLPARDSRPRTAGDLRAGATFI